MKRIAIVALLAFVFLSAIGAGGLAWYQRASLEPSFYDGAIEAFEAEDAATPSAPGSVVFIGSSSIRFWTTLAEDMAPLRVVRRGFGGSHMAHALHYAERLVGGHRPTAVVVYEGDNDLGAGKTQETVVSEFRELVEVLRREAPGSRVYFLTIKPSRLRFDNWPTIRATNEEIGAWAATQPDVDVIDVATPLLADDGEPRDDVFVFDGLHLNSRGYELWTEVVRARLLADLAGTAALR